MNFLSTIWAAGQNAQAIMGSHPLPPRLFAVSGHFFLRFHACENTTCFEWFSILCSDDQSEC